MTANAAWDDWSCRVRLVVDRASTLPAARQHLETLMDEVSRSVNRFRPDSDLSRVNAAAGRMTPVAPRTIGLIETALDAAAITGGAVDPTVGAHVKRAGYTADIAEAQSATSTSSTEDVPQADWASVRIDHTLSLVGIPKGLQLDLGATAKAWTADVAANAIAATFGTSVLVEIGGDISVAGRPSRPWLVEVSETAGEAGQRVELTRGGLATSSTAARRWHTEDGEAHHIIDPRTGRPSVGPWRTVSVWASTAVEANTSSTAALILGDEAVDYLVDMNLAARLVDHHGDVVLTGSWPEQARAA